MSLARILTPKMLLRSICVLACLSVPTLGAEEARQSTPTRKRCVVFLQEGFPTVESERLSVDFLRTALGEFETTFSNIDTLMRPGCLAGADLLVLPYGSAFPLDAWPAIRAHVMDGGSLLNLGGRPLCVPVRRRCGKFESLGVRHSHAREIGLWHSYAAPRRKWIRFAWDDDFAFNPVFEPRARRVFVVAAYRHMTYYRGLGYFLDERGARIAAPVVRQDFIGGRNGPTPLGGARCVYLSFEPAPGYWASSDGEALIGWAARHAARGAVSLWLEAQNATLAPGEVPQVIVHVQRRARTSSSADQPKVRVELLDGERVIESYSVDCVGPEVRRVVVFSKALQPGFYGLRGTYEDHDGPGEGHLTGIWSRDTRLLRSGAALAVDGDYFRLNAASYLPMGVNYFSTDVHATGFFVGDNPCGNAYRWEQDLAEMRRRGITFIRTGTWQNHLEYQDKVTGGVSERYLRALEALLHSAARNGMQVQYTFFAFNPQTIRSGPDGPLLGPGSHPYIDPAAQQAQSRYVASIVGAFKDVPFLSWDLINEPNFGNPRQLWSGNVPNGDPVEQAAWQDWLKTRYQRIEALALAWNTTIGALGREDFSGVSLPAAEALKFRRCGSTEQMRAFDYNLFAHEMFNRWAAQLITTIRTAGSDNLVVVGQDEGGVLDRILNQFYANSGVAFTTNHSWWNDDALLWNSFAAKRPDLPNMHGETGMQPAWRVDGTWGLDEIAANNLIERKLAMSFAAGNSGSLFWYWNYGDEYGLKRSDGSDKIWLEALEGVARFAQEVAPYLDHPVRPQVAVVLPQSLLLSVMNRYAIEAQQKCVRALHYYARSAGYAVGEYQLRFLGAPKLILLPSPWILSESAWQALLDKVRAGAVLAVTGVIDQNEHFQSADRLGPLGIDCSTIRLDTRENRVRLNDQEARLTFSGDKTTFLERGRLNGEADLVRITLGQGRILYCPWPVEMNDDVEAIASYYRMALREAGVRPAYTTNLSDAGILVEPTRLGTGTLYVLVSESSNAMGVSFRDETSGSEHRVPLAPGRVALLMILRDGRVAASYNSSE